MYSTDIFSWALTMASRCSWTGPVWSFPSKSFKSRGKGKMDLQCTFYLVISLLIFMSYVFPLPSKSPWVRPHVWFISMFHMLLPMEQDKWVEEQLALLPFASVKRLRLWLLYPQLSENAAKAMQQVLCRTQASQFSVHPKELHHLKQSLPLALAGRFSG